MKHVIFLALISILVTGCAENPLKEASIEDRGVSSAAGKAEGAVVSQTTPDAAARTTGLAQSDVAGKPLQADSANAQSASGVKTQGLVVPEPEARSLNGTDDKSAVSPGTAGMAIVADQSGAEKLKFVAQPVLDPKDPKSPLAQRRLLFDYDSSAIRDEYRTLLEMHAQYLKNEKAARMIVQGHADERGSREYNIALGQRRAESVFNALNLLGVSNEQMEAVSLGEEKPVSEGHDEDAWAQNRRTELLYQGE